MGVKVPSVVMSVLEPNGAGCRILNILRATELSTLKWLIFLCQFHLKIEYNVEEDILICLSHF